MRIYEAGGAVWVWTFGSLPCPVELSWSDQAAPPSFADWWIPPLLFPTVQTFPVSALLQRTAKGLGASFQRNAGFEIDDNLTGKQRVCLSVGNRQMLQNEKVL